MEGKTKTVIVTGSNKGIGYGIVDNLAGKPGYKIIMACRNLELAKQSQQELLAKHPKASIQSQELDVSKSESIKKFLEVIAHKYKTVDILVNNAGIAWKGDAFNPEVVEGTFSTNFYGTIELSEGIIPLLNQNGKIINIGSMIGKFQFLKNEGWRNKFSDPNITKEQLFGYLKEFQEAVKNGDWEQKGFPKSAYGMSKIGINVYTMKHLAHRDDIKKKHIQVYAQCPGYVNTDMTSHKGPLTIEQGAQTTIFLIELPFKIDPQYQGHFFEKSALSAL